MTVICPVCNTSFNRDPSYIAKTKVCCCSVACRDFLANAASDPEQKERNKKAYRKIWRKRNPSYAAEWKKKNPEAIQGYMSDYCDKNKDRLNAATCKWSRENPDQRNATARRSYARRKDQEKEKRDLNSKNLTNGHIKKILSNGSRLPYKDIPKSLVEIKRVELKLKRTIKELQNV